MLLSLNPYLFFLHGLRCALFIPVQPDCSSCAASIKWPPLFGLWRGRRKIEPMFEASRSPPFEPKWKRTYGQCRAPGTIRTYANQVPYAAEYAADSDTFCLAGRRESHPLAELLTCIQIRKQRGVGGCRSIRKQRGLRLVFSPFAARVS